jgi:hypothetical protein
LFDAVPDVRADAPDIVVPNATSFVRILRHRDVTLAGDNTRDYLVTCRDGTELSDRWIPAERLPPDVVAAYWNGLAELQLSLAQRGPTLLPPHQPQAAQRPGTGLQALGLPAGSQERSS